ncbi:KAT8 regulatory NSL complex subunit 3-like [Ornithodoros turicata]
MSSVFHSGAYVLPGNHYYESRASSAEMYLHRLSGQEKEPNIVVMDHCYAKAWNAHPDSHHAKPAKLLFMKDIPYPEGRDVTCEDVQVDVEAFTARCLLPYDGSRARSLMTECERNTALCARAEESLDDWEEAVSRDGWTNQQNRLFNKIAKILNSDRLAHLSYENVTNEPILRRLAVDTAALKFRQVFALFGWDMKLLQWLHGILMEKTSLSYLAVYLDILQALKAKVPTLVDKMLSKAVASGRAHTIAPETLNILLRRPWDPVAPFLSQHKPKRLPGSPLLVLCPGIPGQAMNLGQPRGRFWFSQLSIMGKLIMVNASGTDSDGNMNNTLENMVGAVKAKVLELKNHFPSRPIVLIGWMIGGVIACQVSLMESVVAVVCLGFPLVGICGARDVDDPMLDSHTPTLFVIGQNALSCGIDDIENFREHMKAESGLVVVGGANDSLRVSSLKKRMEGVTQSVVDRCIVDEMGAFLAWVLTSQHGGGGATGHSTAPSKVNDPGLLVGGRRRRVGIREVPGRVAEFSRRRGRQCRPPYFYDQSHYGGSSTDTTPGSSPTALFSALGVQKKRGTGRRVGRPPKQVTQKRKFGAFSLGGAGLPTPPKQECLNVDDAATSSVARAEQGMPSALEAGDPSSARSESSLSLAMPSFQKQGDTLTHASPTDSADLVPTPSLWTQSLIADSFTSPSPVSSPIRWFQQQSNIITKSLPSSSPASVPDAAEPQPSVTESPKTERELSPQLHPAVISADPTTLERPGTSGESLLFSKPKDDGRFVSLSASGIKVSLLEKSLVGKLPTSRVVASGGDFVALPLLNFQTGQANRVVLPMAGTIDMAADLPSSESGIPADEPLLSSDFMVDECPEHDGDDECPTPLVGSTGYNTLEGLIRNGEEEPGLAKLHPEIASALASPSSHASDSETLVEQHGRTLSSRYRIPFPTIAATRTRRVRMPRFFDV